jgi:GT2 family glycosyltransferase
MAVTLEEKRNSAAVSGDDGVRAAAAANAAAVVSVLIVTWNSEEWVARCIESLPQAFAGLPYEVIVHDNNSGDGTLARVTAIADQRTILQTSGSNLGFAGGINRALSRASGRYVLCLNPDCEPGESSLRLLVEYLDSHPDVGGAVPLLLDDSGTPQREFQLRRLPTLASLTAEILLLDRIVPDNRVTAKYRYRDLDITRPQVIEQPAAAAWMLRRSLMEQVGPFDESFAPAWFEDVDYAVRLARAGATISLVPEAVARHRGGVSLEHVPFGEFLRIWYRNLFRYATKWLPSPQVETLRWVIIAGMLMRSVAVAIGVSKLPSEREASPRMYLAVARDAFRRWEDPSEGV